MQRVAPGPEAASTSPGDGRAPPSPDAAATPQDQVDNFLQAAAGSPDTAAERVREYLAAPDQVHWDPDENVRVVRLLQEPFVTDDVDGGWTVELTVQPVGQLHAHGYLDAPATTGPVDYEFRVVTEGEPADAPGSDPAKLRIADPPPFPLMSDATLADRQYFYPHPIYFWDAERTTLVPDLRWLPLAGEPAEQHPWTVVRWLLEGPAPGLPRAAALPAAAQHVGTPVWEEDQRLVVNFNAATIEGQTLDQFGTQLARSLLQLRDGAELELRIDDRPQEFTHLPRDWGRDDPVRYAVLDGVVRPLADGTGDEEPAPPEALTEEVNQDVEVAALTAGGRLAAVVRTRPDGQEHLSVVQARPRGEDGPVERTTELVADALAQPVWLQESSTDATGDAASDGDHLGLVAADGQLHAFTSAGDVAPVPVSGLAGPITAVAVAPERRRVALIAGDALYVAQLRQESGSVTIQGARRLATSLTDLAGVAFTHETQLVVAGEYDGRVWLYDLTVDGGMETPRRDLSNASVTQLTAHPVPEASHAGIVMYEANGQAYTFLGVPRLLHAEDLAGAPEDADGPPRAPLFLR